MGAGFRTKLEDNASVFPIVIINWEFAENWTLTTVPPDGFRIGLGVSLRWDACDEVSYALTYQYQSDQQRLDNSSMLGNDSTSEVSENFAKVGSPSSPPTTLPNT